MICWRRPHEVKSHRNVPNQKRADPQGADHRHTTGASGEAEGEIEPIPEPRAWLTETGELRIRGVFDDLAAVIVRLTKDNPPLQRELLIRHCGDYDQNHIGYLRKLPELKIATTESSLPHMEA